MTVETAVRGAIDHVVTADAVLYPVNQANVTPKISAPVKRMLVNRGDHVRAGQLLAELESGDLAAAAKRATASINRRRPRIRRLPARRWWRTRPRRRPTCSGATGLRRGARSVRQPAALQKEGALAQKMVDDARVALVQAQSQLETAQRHLEALNQVGQREAIRGAAGADERGQGALR